MKNNCNCVYTNKSSPLNLYSTNFLYNKTKSKSLEKFANNHSPQNNQNNFNNDRDLLYGKIKLFQFEKNNLKQNRINLTNYKMNKKIRNYINKTNTNSLKYFLTEPQNRVIKNAYFHQNFNTINNNIKLNNFLKPTNNQNFYSKAPKKSIMSYFSINNSKNNIEKNRSRNMIKYNIDNNNLGENDEIIKNFEEFQKLKKENSELKKKIGDYQYKVNVLEKKILEIMNLHNENYNLINDEENEIYNSNTINSMDINIDDV